MLIWVLFNQKVCPSKMGPVLWLTDDWRWFIGKRKPLVSHKSPCGKRYFRISFFLGWITGIRLLSITQRKKERDYLILSVLPLLRNLNMMDGSRGLKNNPGFTISITKESFKHHHLLFWEIVIIVTSRLAR
jgi:hypothetical protein